VLRGPDVVKKKKKKKKKRGFLPISDRKSGHGRNTEALKGERQHLGKEVRRRKKSRRVVLAWYAGRIKSRRHPRSNWFRAIQEETLYNSNRKEEGLSGRGAIGHIEKLTLRGRDYKRAGGLGRFLLAKSRIKGRTLYSLEM